jgi:hypothetical protein
MSILLRLLRALVRRVHDGWNPDCRGCDAEMCLCDAGW